MAAISLFDILRDVSQNKKGDLITKENEKDYNAFMVNRFLSMDKTTVFYAEWMDCKPNIPKHLQYLFYHHTIHKAKRFFKYEKGEGQDKELKYIAEYYRCSIERAIEYEKLLTREQKTDIVNFYEKGKGGR